MTPITNEDKAVKRVAGSAQSFDRRESVCCGGKIINWAGRVQFAVGEQKLDWVSHCMICGQPCDTRLNAEYKEPQNENGDPSHTIVK